MCIIFFPKYNDWLRSGRIVVYLREQYQEEIQKIMCIAADIVKVSIDIDAGLSFELISVWQLSLTRTTSNIR